MKQKRRGWQRMMAGWGGGLFLAGGMALSGVAAVTVSPQEMAQKDRWVQQNLLTASNLPPFSFTYGGVSSARMLPSWNRVEADNTLDSNRVEHVLTRTNDAVQVQCVAVDYSDYPMVEWTVYVKNISTRDTPILEGIQGLDLTLLRSNGPEFVLNGNQGDFTTADSYEPFQTTLTPSFATNFSPPSYSGKSCDGPTGWPYYNLQVPGGGVILAIGWPGEWASSFTRDGADGLRIEAGQQLTHLTLQPGETIRTPLIALLFWQGTNVVRAQNIWRHWYLAHEIPRINGELPSAMTQIQVSGSDTNAVKGFLEAGIKPDVCWRDAGGEYTWYPSSNGPYHGGDSYLNTGTWEVDPAKYANGFKPFSDWIHTLGMKFLLWFEPERVGDPNSWLGKNHPEWLLPGESHGSILNEGDPAALDWLIHHTDNLIKSNGIDWYREDMNGGGPLPTWRKHDAPNRQGITENFYVQGHLAYWDALVAMNPGLRIDSCASGGRRNDLETMSRAVPLTRSDFEFTYMPNLVDGNQCQTYGLSSWLPFQGTGCYLYDPYSFRSFYMASFGMGGLSPDNTAAQQQAYSECKQIAPIMLNGDYYPLTPYSLTNTVWMAWQFDRPGQGDGVIQAFRRGKSDQTTKTFLLSGLDPSASYEVTNFDTKEVMKVSGQQLMENGLTVEINDKPGAAVITYQRVKHDTLPMAVITVPCDDPNFGLAPYVWKKSGANNDSRAEATFPGAYFKTIIRGTSSVGVVIDGTANNGCPISSMPVIEYSIDDGSFAVVPLTQTGAIYTLPVASGLDATTSHNFVFYFRAADLGQNRWTASTAHLRIAGISMDTTGFLAAYPMRSKTAIAYGDSITEGVGVDSKFTSWQILGPNDARCTWLGIICSALNCEYGQIGSGGQGMVTAYNVPGCVTAWDHYDSTTSRLVDGRLIPEPDYLFCAHGNNDHVDLTSAYTAWLSTVRQACPHTRIFCIVPPAGIHRSEIAAAVAARNQTGDARVFLIDIPWMTPLAPNLGKPSAGSYDGGHPTLYGQAIFGAGIAVRVQEILSSEKQP